jgi:hypothetical protein
VSSEHSLPSTDIESFGQSGNPQLNDMCLRLQDEATACVSNEAVTSPQREGGECVSLMCTSASSQNEKGGVIDETASNLQSENSSAMNLSSVLYVICVSSFVLLILTA